jgi:hypothetical protein
MLTIGRKHLFKNILRRLADSSGLSLIDMAIMLLVIGLLTTPMIQAYNIWKIHTDFDNNNANFNTAAQAIDNYYFLYGRYPCPANPALGPSDPQYGIANANAAGQCQGPKDPTNRVVFGSLPFVDLKMTPDEALDTYKNKLFYAVTDVLTQTATFDNAAGAIKVLRVPDNASGECDGTSPPIDTGKNYHMLFFSAGPDGQGTFAENGTAGATCTNADPTKITQFENCNNNVTFVDSYCMLNRRAASTGYFDDQFYNSYSSDNTAPNKIWDNAANPNNIGSQGVYLGIGTNTPEHELQVAGNVRTTTDPTAAAPSKTFAGRYCLEHSGGSAASKPRPSPATIRT